MAHHVGSPDCPAELEMVVSFAGRPSDDEREHDLERERELARGRSTRGEEHEPANGSSHDTA